MKVYVDPICEYLRIIADKIENVLYEKTRASIVGEKIS